MERFISTDNPLILASDSPRRRMLLEQLRIPFVQRASNADEGMTTGDPATDACLIAKAKASTVALFEPGKWILGADTMVVLGNHVLGKPADDEQAGRMLQMLSGKAHQVITGICIISPDGLTARMESVATEVRFRALSQEEIEGYVATGEPRGKAGAYAIQGIGAFMVEGITGPYTNVVGLPLCVLVKALVGLGAVRRFPISGSRAG